MNFEETYKTYFKRIFAYACSRTGNETTAEDICINLWQKVLEKFSSYDESKGMSFKSITNIIANRKLAFLIL